MLFFTVAQNRRTQFVFFMAIVGEGEARGVQLVAICNLKTLCISIIHTRSFIFMHKRCGRQNVIHADYHDKTNMFLLPTPAWSVALSFKV